QLHVPGGRPTLRRPGTGPPAGPVTAPWLGLAALIAAQIAYPLVDGPARAVAVVVTVVIGFAVSVGHAAATRGPRTALGLVAVFTGGGLAVEAIGVATGFPFGGYAYT